MTKKEARAILINALAIMHYGNADVVTKKVIEALGNDTGANYRFAFASSVGFNQAEKIQHIESLVDECCKALRR